MMVWHTFTTCAANRLINLLGLVAFSGYTLENNGTITQGANGSVANGGGSSTIHNATTGIYQLQNDGSIGTAYFNNDGLFEKTGGTGTNTITSIFNNTGTITANTGAIAFAGTFNQNDGTLTLTPALLFTAPNYNVNLNGGTITGVGMIGNNGYTLYLQGGTLAPGNPFGTMAVSMQNGLYMYPAAAMSFFIGGASQFSELDLTANPYASYLGGTLNVTLTNGYVPPVGTQFHIITGKVSGGFSTLNVPPGMAVTYSNSTGVYLTITGSTPVQIQPPALSGGKLTFGFGTTNGLAYTVEQNSDLSTTNWTYYTNLIGDGSLYQVTAPVTNIPQMFFRVRQP
jgi:hypothetical protein